MKRIYRNGLSVRYGRKMQAIAGIHYNFSLPDAFWSSANQLAGNHLDDQAFQTEGYLALIRNFFSRVWLLMYLLGASPAVCASFLQGNKNHPLEPMGDDHHSYYLPFATTLRMGDLGYTSNAQAGMDVCYNDLHQYISTLRDAILTPHPEYAGFELMDNGEQAQLNTSLLQIENEYYSPIRPKRVTQSGEAPVVALARKGIEYVEVRCVDINPFLPLGIDADTMRLIDLFLIGCLVDDSPLCDAAGQRQNKTNLQRMVNRGREPGLTLLSRAGVETPLPELAQPILDRMEEVARWHDAESGGTEYQQIVARARQQVGDPALTLSARILDEMSSKQQSFWQLALRYSRKWHQQHLDHPMSDAALETMAQEAALSLQRQRDIESHNSEPFEVYLSQFYAQYQSV
jgi:glutamate--cysteine ligase